MSEEPENHELPATVTGPGSSAGINLELAGVIAASLLRHGQSTAVMHVQLWRYSSESIANIRLAEPLRRHLTEIRQIEQWRPDQWACLRPAPSG